MRGPESGASVALATVAGPAMKPLHQTRATPDVLLDVARKLKKPLIACVSPWSDLRRDAASVGWRRRLGHGAASKAGSNSKGTRAEGRRQRARRGQARRGGARGGIRRRRRRSIRSISCRSRRRRCSTARSRICRGCRKCRIRSPRRCGAPGWKSIRRRRARLGIADGDIVEIASRHGTVARARGAVAGHCARRARDAGRARGTKRSRATRAAAAVIRSRCSRRPWSRKPARWRGPPRA